jgi:hypothetical protein
MSINMHHESWKMQHVIDSSTNKLHHSVPSPDPWAMQKLQPREKGKERLRIGTYWIKRAVITQSV